MTGWRLFYTVLGFICLLLAMLLAFAPPAVGQTAKVIQLSDQDSFLADQLHKQVLDAQEAETKLLDELKKKYLTVPAEDKNAGNCFAYRLGVDGNKFTWVSTAVTGPGTLLSYDSTNGFVRAVTPKCDAACKAAEAKAEVERKKREAEQAQWEKEHPIFYYRAGWDCGQFEFSEDYKFIVPKVSAPKPSTIQFYPTASN